MRQQWVRKCAVCGCILIASAAVSCSKPSDKSRQHTFIAIEQPATISHLTLPGLVRNAQGELFVTLFIHSAFPSATDAADAVAVLKSTDDGQTWSEVSRIASHLTYGAWGYDLTIDDGGGLLMTWVAAVYEAGSPSPFKAILFSRSDDGGNSWTDPEEVSGATSGQRRNPVVAASGDHVHIVWLDEQTPGGEQHTGGEVYCGSSSDRGATWGDPKLLETDLKNKLSSSSVPSICTGPEGHVYCAFFSLRSGQQGGFWLAKSTDDGDSFATSVHAEGALSSISLVQDDGRLCLAAVNATDIKKISMPNPQTDQEIRFFTSSDGGNTWRQPVLIDDDPDDRHKYNVKLVVAGSRRLLACWDDKRGGVYLAVSNDGGSTWGKNLRVGDPSRVGMTPIDITADASTGKFYVAISDVRQREGDSTSLVTGRVVPK